jgi:protein involved in polysaccharide export with SLBB domain
MFKLASCLTAVALAATSIAASAQDKSDMFGQELPMNASAIPSGAVPSNAAQVPQRRVITNATAAEASLLSPYANQSMVNQNGAFSPNALGQRPGANGVQPGSPQPPLGVRREPSEFQKFLAESTGRMLPIYGSQFFSQQAPTFQAQLAGNTPGQGQMGAPGQPSFAPVLSAPVPADYPLGPGDELMIRGWGTVDIDYRAVVDRNGTISIPTVGTVPLAGVKAGDAEGVIRNAVGRMYKGVTVSVNFGQLHAITVYVVGQANRPGTYTVSSLSTLVTALFASGGPNANGSMRHVQVKRGGKVAAELDVYAFIAKGDKSGDIKLQDGDTIYIPPAGGFVALVGKVNTPAIYELKGGSDTIDSLLDIAGGLPIVADPRRAFLERINPEKSHPRSVEEFGLEGVGLKRTLKNGDVLNVTSITPDFSNAVVLRGNVDQPVRASYKSGMRVSDLIPNREYLISRTSTHRQNNVLTTGSNADQDTTEQADTIAARIGGLIDPINWDYAVIERVNRSDLSVQLIPFNLGNVFSNPNGPDNVQLQPGDTVTVFSQDDVAVPIDKRQVFVRVEGEVQVPGVYQMTAGDTLQNLLAKAGGPTSNAYLFGTAFYRDEARKEQQVNLQRAADRLETQVRSAQATEMANLRAMAPADAAAASAQFETERRVAEERIARFRQLKPTGRIAFGLDPNERSFAHLPQVKLQNGDRLVVPSRPAFVHVLGAVNVEASPLWRPNSRVKDYLTLAGTTQDADIDNAFVLRVDGTVVTADSDSLFFGKIGGLEVMPGDSIVVPEKLNKQTGWSAFMQGAREWTQILANFGLGAAAIKTLK